MFEAKKHVQSYGISRWCSCHGSRKFLSEEPGSYLPVKEVTRMDMNTSAINKSSPTVSMQIDKDDIVTGEDAMTKTEEVYRRKIRRYCCSSCTFASCCKAAIIPLLVGL